MGIRNIITNFTSGILSPGMYGRVDVNKYGAGLEVLQNFVPQVQGGIRSRPGMKYVGDAGATAGRLIPFRFNTEQSYALLFTHLEMRILKDGGFVVYPAGHPNAGAIVVITSPIPASRLSALKHTQLTDTMYFAHPTLARIKLQRTDHHLWTFTSVAETVVPAPPAVTLNPSSVAAPTRSYQYIVTGVSDDGMESTSYPVTATNMANPWPAGGTITLSWGVVEGITHFRVYKLTNGSFGFIGDAIGTTTFVDDNIAPSSTVGLPKASTKFSTSDDNPGAVGVFEQRLFYGGSNNQPQTVIASQTALLESFKTNSRVLDTDALEHTIFSEFSERIRHFVALEKLLVFTSESEKVFDHGDNSDALTPTSVKVRTRSKFGCSEVPPLVIGSDVLFVQRGDYRVRNFFYSLEADGYDSTDLTVLVGSRFPDSPIIAWAWQEETQVLWAVTTNGQLLSLTYDRRQQIWAWARHVTSGAVKSIAIVKGEVDSTVYLLVTRTRNPVGGAEDKMGVEIFYEGTRSLVADEAFCVDGGLTYSGAATTVVSGMSHLVGRQVTVLADGGVIPPVTVAADGTVTLPYAASKVVVGLPITCLAKPMRLHIPTNSGTLQGAFKCLNRVTLRVQNSRGIGIRAGGSVVEFKTRIANYDTSAPLDSGDIEITTMDTWNKHGQFTIESSHPLPIQIDAIIAEVDIGD